MTDSTSGTLLERFRARDEGALADLYDLMGARAYGLAFRVLHDGAVAEDVVQNAFATLWEQADRLDPGRGSIEGLLLTIVHRRAVDAARSRQRQSTRSAPLDVDPAGRALITLTDRVRIVAPRGRPGPGPSRAAPPRRRCRRR